MTTQSTWLEDYTERKHAHDIERQSDAVQTAAADILRSLKDINRQLYWALNTQDDGADVDYWPRRLIEDAHTLVDQAHAYRAALKANPPKEEPAS